MHLILFDDTSRNALFPFTHTRAVADIRCGILTMRQRWERMLGLNSSSTLTADYLMRSDEPLVGSDFLFVLGGLFASEELVQAIKNLAPATALWKEEQLLAVRLPKAVPDFHSLEGMANAIAAHLYASEIEVLKRPWEIFSMNERMIVHDFEILSTGRTSQPIPAGVVVSGDEYFFEEGAIIQPGTIINATTGPVYIGVAAEVMEGCMIRGAFALCDHATLKMGAKVYGGTTIGPECKVGGEVSNVVFFGYSNKGHDGFLGNAVIGEWCNLGADTNASNLKNNYDVVKVWDEAASGTVATGLSFCGLMMGDHSKCGINTMFNTGTVVGVSCNIWGGDFPEKFIPSFTWGGPEQMTTYQLPQAMKTADRMMARRGKSLSILDRKVFESVFDNTQSSRLLMFRSDS
ncbi:MAG: GlmU family protein [Bacteroidetes bacterium]|nr:GlmU family protein [Bacteroidota bacterium]